MSSVREIIVEALCRATLANRRQGARGDLVEDAYERFCGILREYSANNLITAFRGEVELDGNAERIKIGGADGIVADGITEINSAFCKAENTIDWMPMNFVSVESFYDGTLPDWTYSWQPCGQNEFYLYLKPRFVYQNRKVKLIYNIQISLGLDDAVNLPIAYVELLTRALAYKMAVDKPRASDTKRNELLGELNKLEAQLKANNADNRILTREVGMRNFDMGVLKSGSFIFGC
jgi:hypothetical protein